MEIEQQKETNRRRKEWPEIARRHNKEQVANNKAVYDRMGSRDGTN